MQEVSQGPAPHPQKLPLSQPGNAVSTGGEVQSLDIPGSQGSSPHYGSASGNAHTPPPSPDPVTGILGRRHFLPRRLGSCHCHGDQLGSWDDLSLSGCSEPVIRRKRPGAGLAAGTPPHPRLVEPSPKGGGAGTFTWARPPIYISLGRTPPWNRSQPQLPPWSEVGGWGVKGHTYLISSADMFITVMFGGKRGPLSLQMCGGTVYSEACFPLPWGRVGRQCGERGASGEGDGGFGGRAL